MRRGVVTATAAASRGTDRMARELRTALLHLFALSGFALAQPLFTVLAGHVEFFVAHGTTFGEVAVLAFAACLALPLLAAPVLALVGLAGATVLAKVQWALVGAVAGVGTLPWLAALGLTGAPAIVAALAFGAVAAAVYASRPLARTFLSYLALGVPVLVSLFLLGSPVRRLLAESSLPSGAVESPAAESRRNTPAVLLVFDELSTASLLGPDGRVDAGRFPNFARLADSSTWYPGAAAVADLTTQAVPAILTGVAPRLEQLPIASEFEGSVFSLLAPLGPLHVQENITRLCPENLCSDERRSRSGPLQLALDTGVIAAHIFLPAPWKDRLPALEGRWTNFAGPPAADTEASAGELAERFLAEIDGTEPAALYYLHLPLPHIPWRYLPSGESYESYERTHYPAGLIRERWSQDPWPALQGLQRYLLQLGYADRLLGRLLDVLEDEALLDDVLLLVTADHGVSFEPGQSRRIAETANIAAIAGVPLFVKLPGQREGATSDRPAQTIDLLPTIADQLGLEPTWSVDGESLLQPSTRREGSRTLTNVLHSAQFPLGDFRRDLDAERRRLLHRVGSGDWSGVLGIRPLGAPTHLEPRRDASQRTIPCEIAWTPRTPPPGPAYVVGRIPEAPSDASRDVAIALDGQVVAWTRSHRSGRDQLFSAWIPQRPRSDQRLEVYAARTDSDGRQWLQPLGGTDDPRPEGRINELRPALLKLRNGSSIPVIAGAVQGSAVILLQPSGVLDIRGWAVEGHGENARAIDRYVVRVDGESFEVQARPFPRPDINQGFDLPATLLPGYALSLGTSSAHTREVRVYGVSARGEATELRYGQDHEYGVIFELVRTDAGERLRANGLELRIVAGALHGEANLKLGAEPSIAGWAFDLYERDVADRIAIFVDGRIARGNRVRQQRGWLVAGYGDAYRWAGYGLELESGEVTPQSEVRVFAVSRAGLASELQLVTEDEPVQE